MRVPSRVVLIGVMGAQLALAGCGLKPKSDPDKVAAARRQAKRDQAACASQVAYDRLKGIAFDQAIRARGGDRANLDKLADYSLARMEQPRVKGRDDALDITKCEGRLVLELPPGAERGFGGERQLTAEVVYTAQASADGNGYIYEMQGGDGITAKLAAFNLQSNSYSAPGAMDETQLAGGPAGSPPQSQSVQASDVREPIPAAPPPSPMPALASRQSPPNVAPSIRRERVAVVSQRSEAHSERGAAVPVPERASDEPREVGPMASPSHSGAATVRGFYQALGSGSGALASNYVIPEKRLSRPYSPEGISRFYGRLPEPLRLTDVTELSDSSYRVTYHYSAGRTRCDGRAVVTTTTRDGHTYIRSIRSLSGC